jgi:hypothetical protein
MRILKSSIKRRLNKAEGIVGPQVEALLICLVEVSYDSDWPAFFG